MTTSPTRRRGPRRTTGTREATRGILARTDEPSPAPVPHTPGGAQVGSGTSLAAGEPCDFTQQMLAEIENLAAQGLTETEIVLRLEIAPHPAQTDRDALEQAITRGRARGSATIKQAQYRAALEGRVTAQNQVLARLQTEVAGDVDDAAITVVRSIIGDTHDQS